MKVIGLAGQQRNGKDVISDYLAERLGWERGAFAASVKKVFCDTFDVDLDFVEEWKANKEIPPGFQMNVRQGLQFIGDGFRKIQDNIWIELAFRGRENPFVISDVRYTNELKKIKKMGGLNILVYRPGYLNDDPNGSEAQIRSYVEYFISHCEEGIWKNRDTDYDYYDLLIDAFIINDGTLEELYHKVDKIIVPYVEEYYGKST